MTLTHFELIAFPSIIVGCITGAVAGARHGPVGIPLGAAAGLVIGFISYLGAMSPMALISPGETHGFRAKLENFIAGPSFFFLIPLAPIGAGITTWLLVRLISG